MNEINDAELSAVRAILAALSGLDEAACKRVMDRFVLSARGPEPEDDRTRLAKELCNAWNGHTTLEMSPNWLAVADAAIARGARP